MFFPFSIRLIALECYCCWLDRDRLCKGKVMEYRRRQVRATSLVVLMVLLVVASVRGNGVKVRLVNGTSPYEGFVELYVNDTIGWLPICGTQGVWNFVDAEVVCNQLGYNGAMRSGRENDLLRNDPRGVVYQVACTANSITINNCTFNIEEPGHCNETARITCNFDGYIGCFNNNASDPVLPDDKTENNQMTIEWCLDYCREGNWTYAGLYRGKYCHCGRQGTDYARRGVSRNDQCSTQCAGNNQQVCGFKKRRISIYQTNLGACGGQVNVTGSRTIYSPGFPGYYPNFQDCTWILSSSNSMSFTMSFVIWTLDGTDDYVIFYDVIDGQRRVIRQFSRSDVPEVVCSHSSEVLVHFYSGNNSGSNTGLFAITFKEVDIACPLPRKIKHGHFNVTGDCTKNWTLSVTCNEGLQVNTSHSSVVCYEGHGWNDTIPSCTADVPVKLTDGVLPNEGFVDIFDSEYGWLKVCRIGDSDKTWNYKSADVVCTQLGYDGAMRPTLSRPEADDIFGIASIDCIGNENSILECNYSPTNSCVDFIKTRCNYIEYTGCYKHDLEDHRWNSSDFVTNSTMRIEWCLEYCRSRDMFYAGLKNKNQCCCGQRSPDEKYRRPNNNCNQACKGDRSQICGGKNALSVYPTSMGACGGHVNESGVIYSPGFPGNYPNNQHCTWILSASKNSTIKMEFLFLNFGGANDSVTMNEVIDGIHYDIGRFEEESDLTEVTLSFSNEVYVTLTSEYGQDVSNGIFALSFEEAELGCQLPIGIENGSFKIIGDSPHSYSLYFTCMDGFQVTGPDSVTCRENRQWTCPFPECLVIECGEPDEVPNASKEGDLYTYKNTVKYSCNDGYYIDGHDVITCDENGNWSKQPTCILKILSTVVPIGEQMSSKTQTDGESSVRLVHGHNKYEGRVEVYRSVPGWTPVCLWKWDLLDADIACRELGRPGAMSMGGDFGALFGDERQRIINLECTGKELSILGCSFDSFPDCYNTGTAKCNYDGYLGCHATQHNGPVPHHYNIHNDAMTIQACLDYCRSIKAPYAGLTRAAHCYCGNHEVSYWGTENTPEKCKTTCGGDRNQICGGNRHVSVYSTDLGACGGNITKPTTIYSPGFPGNISDDNPNCSWSIRLPTGSAVKLEFIISEPSDTNDLLRIVEIFEGRQRVLESRNTTVRSCSNEVDIDMFSYGNTDTERMFAIEVTAVYPDCQLPADLDPSLHLDMFYRCPLFAGDNASVSCHRGYSLATPHYSVVCQEDGTWNDTFPQCKITECDDPGAVNNAFRVGDSLKYLSTITYTCHQGFVGGGAISCVDSGLWTEKPSCNPINCGDPGYIQHAGRTGDDFTYNRSVVYSCRNDYGYFNHGDMAIVCQSDGTWTEKPSCIKIDCGDPGDVENADRYGHKFTYKNTVVYRCHNGYYSNESDVIVCQENASWTSKPKCLKNNTIRELAAVEPNVLDTGIIAGICVGALMLLTIIAAVAIIKRRRKLHEKKSSMDILLRDHPFNDVIEGKKTQNNGGWIIIDDTAPDKCTKPAKHFYEKCASTSTEMTSEYGERDYEEMDEDLDYDCIDTVSSGSETADSTNTRCHGDHPTLPAHERFRTEGSQLGTAAKDDAVMVENILYQSADVDEVEDDEYAEIDDADTSQTPPDENEHDSLPSAQMADNSEVIYYVLEGP